MYSDVGRIMVTTLMRNLLLVPPLNDVKIDASGKHALYQPAMMCDALIG